MLSANNIKESCSNCVKRGDIVTKKWYRLELFVDRLIFPALVVLVILVILELFFPSFAEPYRDTIDAADGAIILLFIVDLVFKYQRSRSMKGFLRQYWLEIIAVIPFFLLFRLVDGLVGLFGAFGEVSKEGQQVVHVGTELGRQAKEELKLSRYLVRTGARLSESERLLKLFRFLRPILRLPRFLILIKSDYEKRALTFLHFFSPPHSSSKKKRGKN